MYRRLDCIDTHDVNYLDIENRKEGYHLPLLESVDVYYKVNYNDTVIANYLEMLAALLDCEILPCPSLENWSPRNTLELEQPVL